MTETSTPVDLMPIQRALAEVVGTCPNCAVEALVPLLAFEMVRATWPGSPAELLHAVVARLATEVGVAIKVRNMIERGDCVGSA